MLSSGDRGSKSGAEVRWMRWTRGGEDKPLLLLDVAD